MYHLFAECKVARMGVVILGAVHIRKAIEKKQAGLDEEKPLKKGLLCYP
jgi:hypothetical protein